MTRCYRFGEFRLHAATRELWRGGAPVALPPRAFDCLVYLIEQRDRAVGRDELIAAVWGRTEIAEGMLGQSVLAARRALEDTGKEQQFIRTVFRFGYHWVAAIETIEADADEAPASTAATTESIPASPTPGPAAPATDPVVAHQPAPGNRRVSRRWLALCAAGLLVLAASGLQRDAGMHRPPPIPTQRDQGAIALVLPVSVSAGAGFDWIRLGLMDLIGSRLRSAGLAVVPSDNAVALARLSPPGMDAAARTAALAGATGASLVVDAHAEAMGDRWRITLHTASDRRAALLAIGESADVLDAARSAADQMARQLGYAPLPGAPATTDPSDVSLLSQQIQAAILGNHLDSARALIANAPATQRALPELRLRLAQIDYQAGNLDAAESGFGAVAAQVPAEEDAVMHARALTSLGVIAAMRDNATLAKTRFDEAIALLRVERAPDALGQALLARASLIGTIGDYDRALQDFAEARSALESAGNLLALAVLDSNLGALDLLRLRLVEAEPVLRRAADRFATLGMPAAEINALAGAADLKLTLLEPDAALAMEPRLRELVGLVSDPARQRNAELSRARILIANGRLREAAALLHSTLAAADRANDRAALAQGHAIAAQLAQAHGDTRQAASEADTALRGFIGTDDARERALTLHLRIRALLADGSLDAAAASLEAFPKPGERDDEAAARMYVRLAVADCAAATGDPEAGKAYAHALAEAEALRIPIDLREAARAYADWLVHRGDLAQASAVAERIAGWTSRDFDSTLMRLRIQHALGDVALWRGALTRAQALAGERPIPAELTTSPSVR